MTQPFTDDSPEQFEPSAREIAKSAMKGLAREIPPELLTKVIEYATGAVHDGIQFGESMAGLYDEKNGLLAHYTLGYIQGLTDATTGLKGETI